MEISQTLVAQITTVTWIVGGLSIPVGFFGWAFGGGLFKPAPDVLPRGSVQFYVVAGAIFIFFASLFLGSGTCLAALIQLGEGFCPTLSHRRRGNAPYYLMTIISGAMMVLWSLLVFRKPKKRHQP